MKWLYKGKPKFAIPKNAYGFVYSITYVGEPIEGEIASNKYYIGKKALHFSKKKRITKKEKLASGNNRKRFKIDVTESDWKTYWGSSTLLLKDIEKYGEKNFERRIIRFCFDKINLTYVEMEYQFKFDILRTDSYNISIGGKFFKGKIK